MGSFKLEPNRRYRMPVLFGPTVGPRQGPDGQKFDGSNNLFTTTTARFLTSREAIESILPPKFEIDGEPIVTIEHTILHDLPWLAGRSYSMLGVKVPVVYSGLNRTFRGSLLTVLWENRAEPIISGREELGFNKLYCELPDPKQDPEKRVCDALWDGHLFFHMELTNLEPAKAKSSSRSDGMLHYAYMPPIWSEGGVSSEPRVMLSPTPKTPSKVEEHLIGDVDFSFVESTFQQMPTMFHIVNVLADFPVYEVFKGTFTKARGKGDLSNQLIIS